MILSKLSVQRAEMEKLIQELYPGDRKVLVHGEGADGARVMLIGEAPGEQETLKRRPFVGKAGKNLDEFLEIAWLDRSDLYVSNAVKFRPTKISAAEAGETVKFDKVLAVIDEENTVFGAPVIEGASVSANVVKNGKGKKIRVYKMKPKKGYRRTQGHRQPYTKVQIETINA